jgi:hydrogenase nickel incorporation protein HypA/HybF
MHEMAMCDAIVAAAVRRAAGRRLTGMRVRIGGHAVDRDVIAQGIQLAASGTSAEGAEVDLIICPMSMSCGDCGHTGLVTDHVTMVACPACGGLDVEVTGNEDVLLESITVATDDAQQMAAR